jgi:hypothetical protein
MPSSMRPCVLWWWVVPLTVSCAAIMYVMQWINDVQQDATIYYYEEFVTINTSDITILDNVHCPDICLKRYVSETGCFHHQVRTNSYSVWPVRKSWSWSPDLSRNLSFLVTTSDEGSRSSFRNTVSEETQDVGQHPNNIHGSLYR